MSGHDTPVWPVSSNGPPEAQPSGAAAFTPSLIMVATAYAEACADCEAARVSGDPPPNSKWSAAWVRRLRLQAQLLDVARGFTDRETLPPEMR